MSTSIILIAAGLFCLGVCGLVFYKLSPRAGEASSRWTGTDAGGTAVALGLMALLMAGVGMLLKGVFT